MCKKYFYVIVFFIYLYVVVIYIFKRKFINVIEYCYKLWLYLKEWILNESSMLNIY